MSCLLLKLVVCPIALIVSAWIFPNVQFGSYFQPIMIGIILALIGIAMEYMLLRKGTLWISTILDFVVTLVIVYIVSNLYPGAEVTFFGAALTAALIALFEYFNHSWLIQSGRTQKSPA